MRRRGPMTHVELVDDDGPDDPVTDNEPRLGDDRHRPDEGTRPDTAETDRVHGRRRLAARLGVGLLVVLVAGGVTGQALVATRERERLEALTDVPGVLDVLDGPPRVLWTSPDGAELATSVRTAQGLLVSVQDAPDGAVTAVATDAGTGAAAWETELLGATDVLVAPDEDDLLRSTAWCEERATDGAVVCLADNGFTRFESGERDVVPPTVSRFLVLDPRDGAVTEDLSDMVREPRTDRSFVLLGDLVVLCDLRVDEAHAQAVARDGTVVWSTTVPSGPSMFLLGAHCMGRDDVALVGTSTQVRVLDAAGLTVNEAELGVDGYLAGVVDDGFVLQTSTDRSSSPTVGTTILRAGTTLTLPGAYVPMTLDDGSVPGLLLTSDVDGLHAWDAQGVRRWSTDASTTTAAATSGGRTSVLDGRLHLSGDGTLLTLDAATGRELWRTPGTTLRETHLTDGRHLVTLDSVTTGTDVVGIDPVDGAVAWRTPAPAGVDELSSISGVLAAYGSGSDPASTSEVFVLGAGS